MNQHWAAARRLMSLATVLGATAAALPAGAQPASPISITDCSVLQDTTMNDRGFWRPFGPYRYSSIYTDGIRIAYVNNSPKPATRIAFAVNYRGDVEHIIDAGSFSPGARIDHTFGEFSGYAWLGPAPNSCRAVAVRFADGTHWRSPRAQQRSAGQ